jgi:tetratricopeptide (TPR) repeat protein
MARSLVAFACLLSASSAAAQDEAAERRALALFEQAEESYEAGDLERAVELLLEARSIYADEPVLLYNLARAYEGLGRLEEALESYRVYLREEPNPPARGAIEQRVAAIEEQLASRRALESEREELARRARENERRSVEDEPSAGAWPWVVMSVGVAGLATATVFGVLALDREADAAAATVQLDALQAYEEGDRFATVSTIAFIAGGAIAGAGLTWLIVDLALEGGEGPTLALGTQGLVFSGRLP